MSKLSAPHKRLIAIASLGGALEFYDFVVFVFLAHVIAHQFYSAMSPTLALFASLATFAIGYIIRPIGGLLFSHMGDTKGRKQSFALTVLFMAVATFGIGVLPGYAQIGIWAPIILICLRVVQGFALGGEIPGAITFIFEHVPVDHRAFATACIFAVMNLGMLAAQGLIAGLTHLLSAQGFMDWGWRLLFIIGGLGGFIGLYIRRKLHESEEFTQSQKSKLPLRNVLRDFRVETMLGVGILCLGASCLFLFYLDMPVFIREHVSALKQHLSWLMPSSLMFYTMTLFFFGRLSDRIGWHKAYQMAAILAIVTSVPLFYGITQGGLSIVIACFVLAGVITGLLTATYAALIARMFPTPVRFTGIALCYNLAFAIFGGTLPLLIEALTRVSGSIISPGWYLCSVGFIGLLSIMAVNKEINGRNS